MDPYQEYLSVNTRLAAGEAVLFSQRGAAARRDQAADRALVYPRLGVYTGAGASHSWLWFADLFDRLGLYDLVFLDENQVQNGALTGIDVLAVSGGDTFAVAEALGARGADEIESFVQSGGLYLGSCAGAYLPLNSSKKPLHFFNFVNAKITNLSQTLSRTGMTSEKFCTPYGCSYIFHPVREAVRVAIREVPPFTAAEIEAPLYGGPPLTAGDNAEVLALYSGFTDKTQFLVDEDLARETVIGRAAVVRSPLERGWFYLFGPHFEHPRFAAANCLLAEAIYWDAPRRSAFQRRPDDRIPLISETAAHTSIRDIKREISNARIVAAGLETRPVQWRLGRKIYEPLKIRVFLETIWSRIGLMEKSYRLKATGDELARLIDRAKETSRLVREVKHGLDDRADTTESARKMFRALGDSAGRFLAVYFRTQFFTMVSGGPVWRARSISGRTRKTVRQSRPSGRSSH